MSESAKASAAWTVAPEGYLHRNPPRWPGGCRRSSTYVTVRDGTQLAVDVHLPEGAPADARLPAIAIFTPYYRRFALAEDAPAAVEASPNTGHYRDFFVPHGYAVVVVDTRGAGASFGCRYAFRSPVERDDYHDIADWIVAQPWSNGHIGSTGISYVGAAADFLASTGHPAVKAVIPTFAVWDTYGDHYYPGGVLLNNLAAGYNDLMQALDLDRREQLAKYPYFADPHFRGPAPVDDDPGGMLLAQALTEHTANFNLQDLLYRLEFRDSTLSYDPDFSSATISPYAYADGIGAHTAYCCVSGWMDGGAYTNAAVNRFLSLKNPANRLLIGPWDHGARTNVSPYRETQKPAFPLLAECLRFFDHHVKGIATGLEQEPRIHYFTMAEEQWKSADAWPPPAAGRTFWLGGGGTLATEPDSGTDAYRADYACATGRQTRYERLSATAVEAYYADWHGRDARMLTYTSAPLDTDIEVSGHPLAAVRLACSERDCTLFAYLEDVDDGGTCRYVTEGVLRALHRRTGEAPPNHRVVGPYHPYTRAAAELLRPDEPAELAFSLMPTSWLFRKGHRIRLAFAAADNDHFSRIPDGRPPLLTFHRAGSQLTLPVVPR